MKPLKLAFKIKDGDNEVELAVQSPSSQTRQKGRLVHAKKFNEAVEAGAMLRVQLDTYLEKHKIWDKDRQAEYERLRKVILDGERAIAEKKRHGKPLKLTEARQIALDMTRSRTEMQELLMQRNRVDANTADSIADQEQFNFFVSACTVYNDTGKPYFTYDGEHSSLDKYIEVGGEPVAAEAAAKLNEVMFGTEKDIYAGLPENQFLKKFKFVDEDLHLVDKQGRKVDEQGRLVDKNGRFVNEGGEFVDAEGNRVDEEGRYVFSPSSFLDEEGNPIDEEGSSPVENEPPPEVATLTSVEPPMQVEPPGSKSEENHQVEDLDITLEKGQVDFARWGVPKNSPEYVES